MKAHFVSLFAFVPAFCVSLNINPICDPGDILIDTVIVDGVEYHKLVLNTYPLMISGSSEAGLPSLPYIVKTFLLPPDTEISDLTISNERWTALPGKYYLYPAQGNLMGDTTFTLPDSLVYSWETPFPEEPVGYPSQGSALGYSVVTVTGTPVRYTPSDSLVEVLTRMRVSFDLLPSTHERIAPIRETELSAEVRQMNILGLVANPELISMYESPEICDRTTNYSGLNIFDAPSPEGDGVDMIIITSGPDETGPDLTEAFQELANYRTSQGIITVIRTVGWIENTYSGCDTQEKIRNFIRDAHENWGVQAIILGGDDWIVPVRYYDANNLESYYSADDYYADIDGDWTYNSGSWSIPEDTTAYVDLLVGRLPVDNSDDVETITNKIIIYETEVDNSSGFCRSLVLMGSCEVLPEVISGFMGLVADLQSAGAIFDYLDLPLELYWDPNLRPPLDTFTRENVLQAFDTGYNLAIHCDHSEIHKIGAGGDPHLTINDYDFGSMDNQDRTGILWTVGCYPGYFTEAECFAEAGLLTDAESGFAAIMANSTTGGVWDWEWCLSFCDALYGTGWTQWGGQMPVNWPVSYLGQAFRHQKNFKPAGSGYYNDYNYVKHHLFGDPFMFVWRDSPKALTVTCSPPTGVTTGTQTISVLVTKLVGMIQIPVSDATVCIWNAESNDVFAMGRTASNGTVVFSDLEISQTGYLTVTATKRRDGTDVASFIPGTATISVTQATGALVCLDSAVINDDNIGSSQGSGDGVINPGETIELYVTAGNTGNSTATNVSAELNVISGGGYVSVSSGTTTFSDILSGDTEQSSTPFIFSVADNVESYSAIQFEIEFSFNLTQSWESPYCCSIFSEAYSIPLVDIDYSRTLTQVTINMTDILLVNSGVGDGLDLGMTVSSIYPAEPFTCTPLSNLGSLSPDECLEIPNPNQLSLVVTPRNPSTSAWINPAALGCTFNIEVSSSGGEFAAKTVNFDEVQSPGDLGSIGSLDLIEADSNSLELDWAHGGSTADIVRFYLYYGKSRDPLVRSTSMPIPVANGLLSGLDPETEYIVDVTAVDAIGRQSYPGNGDLSTTCTVTDGWPVQLEGGTGTGPVIVNMDGDVEKEVVAVSSFGNVYIIEPDGQMEVLAPPSSFDYDRFVSLSVGDVDNDSDNEIVISCQQDIVDGDAAILLYDEISQGNWSKDVVGTFGPDETVCGAEATGTPVLLQANDSATLEIAVRTRGNSTSLHMWQWDTGQQDWIEPNGFPISISGDFFAEPIAVDFDDDGYDELIVTQTSNNYSALHIVDFNSNGFSESDIQLTELGPDYMVYSTLAAVEYNGEIYIVGVARYTENWKKFFVYKITSPNAGMIWYSSSPLSGTDSNGNMGGPAIGYADTGEVPDIFYALGNSMTTWQLLSGQPISSSDDMSINKHGEVYSATKSATIAAGTTSRDALETVPFVGFSTKFYGHDPLDDMNVLLGFPTWTETASWTAPAVGDVDNDGLFEVLTSNGSGELTLYEWDGYATANCWPMYQHDTHRTGFFNSGRSLNGFDIELQETEVTRVSGRSPQSISLTVRVTGCSQVQTNQHIEETHLIGNLPDRSVLQCRNDEFESDNQSALRGENSISETRPSLETPVSDHEITIAAFCRGEVIARGSVPLIDGQYRITLPVEESCLAGITVVTDPENRFIEMDETNNTQIVDFSSFGSASDFSITLQSPSANICAAVVLPEGSSMGMTFSVYSLDGRLQSRVQTEALPAGTHMIDLFHGAESTDIPSGVYLVHIEGAGIETLVRKVVVL